MIGKIIERVATQKMVLIAVCENGKNYVFDRAYFATWFGNRSARPIGMSPERAGKVLLKSVTRSRNPKFAVERSPALGETVYLVFWFPQGSEFDPDAWQGKIVCANDETVVNEFKRRVIDTALGRARSKLSLRNMQQIA